MDAGLSVGMRHFDSASFYNNEAWPRVPWHVHLLLFPWGRVIPPTYLWVKFAYCNDIWHMSLMDIHTYIYIYIYIHMYMIQ